MKIKSFIAFILSLVLLIPNSVLAAESESENKSYLTYDYFRRLMTYASELYIDDDITVDELIDIALEKAADENPEFVEQLLKAGFSALDEYSQYYTATELDSYLNDINHIFYGIGVVIQQSDNFIEITSCLEDGSAYAAGIQPGDKIYSVDGVSAEGKTVTQVQNMILGEVDTLVTVTVLRGTTQITYELKRCPVSSATVNYGILKGNIGYIEIINFAEKTAEEFKSGLEMMDENGITKIILDLRGNPGGYLFSAIDIAKLIVPKGVIVQTMFRNEGKNEVYYSDLKDAKYEFAVLVNQHTASAAEVLAGAMQDSGVGTLIGETTYGKAVIQEIYRLVSGGFKLTTGHYLTRDGHEINNIGIEPDEYVVNTTQWVDMSNYTPFDYKTKWKVGETGEGVLAAKERLRGLGYYTGPLDSKFNTALEKAVTAFQADQDLYPYGVLDISTQVRIENVFCKTEEVVDNQFERAYTMFGGIVE